MLKTRKYNIMLALIGALMLSSCDSGDIYPQADPSDDTRTLTLTGVFTGTETVPAASERERKLMVFTYPAGSSTYNRSVRISSISPEQADAELAVTLVPAAAARYSLEITDAANETLWEVSSGAIEQGTSAQEVNLGNVNLLSYNRLQAQLFNQSCTSCHSSANPSAGLVLESGVSYSNIVNHATRDGSGTIIVPSDVENSVMYQKLTSESDFHSRFSTLKSNDTNLLKTWIISGAN